MGLTNQHITAYAKSIKSRRSLRVLLVDRSEDVMLIMADLMNHLGHDCVQATSALEALHHASAFVPDVILAGMRLMDCSGNELAERLRDNPFTAKAVLIAITGHHIHEANEEDFVQFNHVLQKPFSINVLEDLLNFCLISRMPG